MKAILLLVPLAQSSSAGDRWFTAPAIMAAAITSALTIVGIVLKDFAFKSLEDRRMEKKASSAIYERYSNPLVTSAISLQNRFYEILYQPHRPVYLKGEGINSNTSPGGSFRAYKKLSTMYRLAAVLGWIRACRREFSYLRVADPGNTAAVAEAIDEFEDALANGQWVEQERVSRLCELWRLCGRVKLRDTGTLEQLGVQIDNLVWDHLENPRVEDVSLLNEESRKTLCRAVADCLSKHPNTNAVSELSIDRSWPDAISIIGMREAWVYRDWQAAIGDIMIQSTSGDSRKFEVVGFGDFEEMHSGGNEKQKLALARLLAIFDDVNFSIEDRFDAPTSPASCHCKCQCKAGSGYSSNSGRSLDRAHQGAGTRERDESRI